MWNTVLPQGPYYIVSYGPIYRDEIALFRLERYIENVIFRKRAISDFADLGSKIL